MPQTILFLQANKIPIRILALQAIILQLYLLFSDLFEILNYENLGKIKLYFDIFYIFIILKNIHANDIKYSQETTCSLNKNWNILVSKTP